MLRCLGKEERHELRTRIDDEESDHSSRGYWIWLMAQVGLTERSYSFDAIQRDLTELYATAGTPGGVFDASSFGVVGDGVADDSAALILAVNALAKAGSGKLLIRGKVLFSQHSPSSGAAITLDGLSNVSIEFSPGSELIMNNLNGVSGTSHGIQVLGACSNVWIVNARIRWASIPTRSLGDGIRLLGYPSDLAPAGGWTATTGPVRDVHLVNCEVINAPQTGAIFMGCSDIFVENFRADSTMADGLHFNACRRINVNGHTAFLAGDDGLAFVTYYDPSVVWQGTNGPFNQPSLGAWSNNGVATGIFVEGGTADGMRISGSLDLSISGATFKNKTVCGIVIDSAIVGQGVNWGYQASQGIKVGDVRITGCSTGLNLQTFGAIDSTSASKYWDFEVFVDGVSIANCSNWSVSVLGSGTALSKVSGVTLKNISAIPGSGGGGAGGCQFSALYNCNISGISLTGAASIFFKGSDVSPSGALSTMPLHNVQIRDIACTGGQITIRDLRQFVADRIRSVNAPGTGLQFTDIIDAEIGTIEASMPNRANGGQYGVLITQVANIQIAKVRVTMDSNNGGSWQSMQIGGGDATDIAMKNSIIRNFTYTNTLNQTGNDIVTQGGGFGPNNYSAFASWYNGGEASPIWRTTSLSAGSLPG